jgi:hypothetical protein
MGFWKNFINAWKTAEEEEKWKAQFNKKKIPNELQAEKEEFTARGEPWVGILRMDVDPSDLANGAFELDWNPIFVARLVKAGYSGRDDQAIVDQWFNRICENVVAGTYEQEIADPEKRKRIQRKQITDDFSEMS